MRLPEDFLNSLRGLEGFDKEAFEKLHAGGEQVTSVRLNPARQISQFGNFQIAQSNRVPWAQYGYYLNQRPSFTFDPLFHAGLYYVQEASGMFLEQAWRQCVDTTKTLCVLDLAAAPGGKSTHLQSLMSEDSLLVSNEVIRARAKILQDNIIKWGAENVVVTNNDPKDFAALENYFDVIVLDAPCSGSGLFRRDKEAIDEWSLNNVELCSQRQQRILADVWPALKQGGMLVYSTCSYSKEEDEEIVDWMMKEFEIENLKLRIEHDWNIVESHSQSGAVGYRLWPYKLKGEGFFIACFKKLSGGGEFSSKHKKRLEHLARKETQLVEKWVKQNGYVLVRKDDTIHALPRDLEEKINLLSQKLLVNYFGVGLGELVREKFIPSHALALSNLVADDVEKIALNYDDAIRYLQRKDLHRAQASLGWKLVTYEGFPLGWINVLHNRINNYYPKALRILRDI